jgi:putative ABC transport system substrate-binding protein
LKRREFITLIGGAAAAWPLAARAQQGERVRRVGVLAGAAAEGDPYAQAFQAIFRQTLQQLGWTEGRNVTAGGPAAVAILHADTQRN